MLNVLVEAQNECPVAAMDPLTPFSVALVALTPVAAWVVGAIEVGAT